MEEGVEGRGEVARRQSGPRPSNDGDGDEVRGRRRQESAKRIWKVRMAKGGGMGWVDGGGMTRFLMKMSTKTSL